MFLFWAWRKLRKIICILTINDAFCTNLEKWVKYLQFNKIDQYVLLTRMKTIEPLTTDFCDALHNTEAETQWDIYIRNLKTNLWLCAWTLYTELPTMKCCQCALLTESGKLSIFICWAKNLNLAVRFEMEREKPFSAYLKANESSLSTASDSWKTANGKEPRKNAHFDFAIFDVLQHFRFQYNR